MKYDSKTGMIISSTEMEIFMMWLNDDDIQKVYTFQQFLDGIKKQGIKVSLIEGEE